MTSESDRLLEQLADQVDALDAAKEFLANVDEKKAAALAVVACMPGDIAATLRALAALTGAAAPAAAPPPAAPSPRPPVRPAASPLFGSVPPAALGEGTGGLGLGDGPDPDDEVEEENDEDAGPAEPEPSGDDEDDEGERPTPAPKARAFRRGPGRRGPRATEPVDERVLALMREKVRLGPNDVAAALRLSRGQASASLGRLATRGLLRKPEGRGAPYEVAGAPPAPAPAPAAAAAPRRRPEGGPLAVNGKRKPYAAVAEGAATLAGRILALLASGAQLPADAIARELREPTFEVQYALGGLWSAKRLRKDESTRPAKWSIARAERGAA
ncbi:MAG TPA: hypothetical protein VFS43_38235 [Polyangiaceae bacterium]|nr:hypothetical protein [Polyangiaceae bacterium]